MNATETLEIKMPVDTYDTLYAMRHVFDNDTCMEKTDIIMMPETVVYGENRHYYDAANSRVLVCNGVLIRECQVDKQNWGDTPFCFSLPKITKKEIKQLAVDGNVTLTIETEAATNYEYVFASVCEGTPAPSSNRQPKKKPKTQKKEKEEIKWFKLPLPKGLHTSVKRICAAGGTMEQYIIKATQDRVRSDDKSA